MDFDIGNMLYVVITLVAIIASLLGKKKKPGKQESKPGFLDKLDQILKMGQEDPAVRTLEDYEPDLIEETEGQDQEIVPEVSGGTKMVSSLMEEYESLLISRGGSVISEMQYEGENSTSPLEVIELEDEGGADYFEIIKDFDAGTAVVYSAIINRVEY